VATFTIPAGHIDSFQTAEERARERVPDVERVEFAAPESVLVVEDNMIIALDAEAHMRELGARQVEIASTTAAAFALIESTAFDLVLLDVNLGGETSEEVARLLIAQSIPLVFATGYGDLQDFEDAFEDVPIVQKPYDANKIAEAIIRIRGI